MRRHLDRIHQQFLEDADYLKGVTAWAMCGLGGLSFVLESATQGVEISHGYRAALCAAAAAVVMLVNLLPSGERRDGWYMVSRLALPVLTAFVAVHWILDATVGNRWLLLIPAVFVGYLVIVAGVVVERAWKSRPLEARPISRPTEDERPTSCTREPP